MRKRAPWSAGCLVKRWVDPGSRLSGTRNTFFSSDLTLIEGDRALHRAAATSRISLSQISGLRALLASRAAHWSVHAITPRIVDIARGPFPNEWIRALDAIHLATALRLREIHPDLAVLTLDRRVRENAVALGFEVLPAEF